MNLAADRAEAPSKARLRLWLRLLKTTRGIEGVLRERLRTEFGTTLPRFDVMAALSRAPEGMRMSEISGRLRVSNGNVTGIVDRLVSDGLARRVPAPGDRRAAVVRLTALGRDEFERQAAAHEAWIDELLSGIGAEASGRIDRALDALAEEETV
ncbi:MAG: MarR family transcriptional regulator [Paracoccaceae bacterium]|nr:MarR family transcriptional regulator [Paracoccaceae bacterium]